MLIPETCFSLVKLTRRIMKLKRRFIHFPEKGFEPLWMRYLCLPFPWHNTILSGLSTCQNTWEKEGDREKSRQRGKERGKDFLSLQTLWSDTVQYSVWPSRYLCIITECCLDDSHVIPHRGFGKIKRHCKMLCRTAEQNEWCSHHSLEKFQFLLWFQFLAAKFGRGTWNPNFLFVRCT